MSFCSVSACVLSGDGAHDGIAHDVAAAVNHIGGGVGENVCGELAGLAVGSEIHILIGRALLGQHILCIGDRRFVAVQCEGVDADESAALLRRAPCSALPARQAHPRTGLQVVNQKFTTVTALPENSSSLVTSFPSRSLPTKAGEFLHAAVIAAVVGEHAGVAGDVHAAVRGHAHGAVKGFLCRLGVLFLDHGQLAFNVADLFRLACGSASARPP